MDNIDILKKAGLNEAQAKVYSTLLSNGMLTPAKIAKETGETRENCYLICKKLEEMDLVQKTDNKKVTYRVLNPSNLEVLAEKRRKIVQENEKKVKDNMSSLLNIFYANNEMPGSRTIEGIEGIKEIYRDMLRVGQDVYLLRTPADRMLGSDDDGGFLRKYRNALSRTNIKTYALAPDKPQARKKELSGRDKEVGFVRTKIPRDAYTAPVAVHVYGGKVAFVAFGEIPMATIITSPLIAEAVKQMLEIMMKFYRENYPQ